MQLLKIRYYQLKRDLGILFFLIIALLFTVSFLAFNHPSKIGYYVVGVLFYAFYSFHHNRKDKAFVLKHFNDPVKQIVIEYQLFLVPLSLPCLFTQYWYCFPIMHLLILCVTFIKTKHKIQPKLFFITKFFKNDYVFISGIRKNGLPLLVFGIFALLLSPLKLFALVALFLFNSVIFSFYDTNECVQLLQACHQSPKQFLFSTFHSALLKLLIINVPVITINSLFNPDMVSFNLYFLGYNVLILATVIAMKYANFNYHKSENNNQIKLIIIIIGLFIPYLAILAVVFFIQSRTDALKNLNHYLDDSNT